MPRKPGRMYRDTRGQSYTRREYMGGVPPPRISQFDLGDPAGDFPLSLDLIAEESCQIRHIALESARIAANRHIQRRVGRNAYHLKIRVYPHHVLRENKIAVGAGADRISDGMRAAFGKAIGTAARVTKGQRLMTIRTTKPNLDFAKEALRKAGSKLPTPCRIVVNDAGGLVGGLVA